MKKALNLQQESTKLQTTLITKNYFFYEKEDFTIYGVILYDDSIVGFSSGSLQD